ncbi:MAG: hypothetical protein QME57_02155 [Patescibacteria group bacterium]|nr:hypothetical protein [Patescibacteria group bacterium]
MAKKIKKNVTLDDLAGMIKRGFDEDTKEHQKILKILDRHAVILIGDTEILNEHTKKLNEHY